MKRFAFLLFVFTLLFSSCALHNGLTYNANNHTTEVVLSEKNFTVNETVQGEAKATYILGIGGLSKKALVAEARANMMSNTDLIGSSKAVINETVEVKNAYFLFANVMTVTVSANIIEFTK